PRLGGRGGSAGALDAGSAPSAKVGFPGRRRGRVGLDEAFNPGSDPLWPLLPTRSDQAGSGRAPRTEGWSAPVPSRRDGSSRCGSSRRRAPSAGGNGAEAKLGDGANGAGGGTKSWSARVRNPAPAVVRSPGGASAP